MAIAAQPLAHTPDGVMLRRREAPSRSTHRMPSWAYLLHCADGSYYAGCTTDLDKRDGQHRAGEIAGYTSARRPIELAWAEGFANLDDAIAAERRIKGWSRAKKQALIAGNWERIGRLASRVKRPAHHPPNSCS